MTSPIDYGHISSMTDSHNEFKGYIQEQPNSNLRHDAWNFENSWSHGLCNCAEEYEETCYSIWCCPCFSCQLAWRMNESCWITCCIPWYLGSLRTKMRTAFRIKGSYFSDFCIGIFCPICTALQMASELRFRNVTK